MSAGIMLAEGGSRSTNLPPLPAASYPPPSASWAASSMDPTSLPRLLTRRGGIKIRAEPVIEGESSRSRVCFGKGRTEGKENPLWGIALFATHGAFREAGIHVDGQQFAHQIVSKFYHNIDTKRQQRAGQERRGQEQQKRHTRQTRRGGRRSRRNRTVELWERWPKRFADGR